MNSVDKIGNDNENSGSWGACGNWVSCENCETLRARVKNLEDMLSDVVTVMTHLNDIYKDNVNIDTINKLLAK